MAPEIGEGFRGVEGNLGYLLRQAQQAMRSSIEHALKGTGVTASQYTILSLLEVRPGISGVEIARDSMMTAQSVNELVLVLTRSGLVRRTARKGDRRQLLAFLTPAGAAKLKVATPLVRSVERASVRGLTTAETRQLRQWLVGMAESLETEAPGGSLQTRHT